MSLSPLDSNGSADLQQRVSDPAEEFAYTLDASNVVFSAHKVRLTCFCYHTIHKLSSRFTCLLLVSYTILLPADNCSNNSIHRNSLGIFWTPSSDHLEKQMVTFTFFCFRLATEQSSFIF